jgi:hypothetical protein
LLISYSIQHLASSIRPKYGTSDALCTTLITVSTDRAQHRRMGVAGGACAAKRRGRTTRHGRPPLPPAKNKGRT